METEKGFIINWSKRSKTNFVWFVKHEKINNGQPSPINRGDIEAYLNECKKKL